MRKDQACLLAELIGLRRAFEVFEDRVALLPKPFEALQQEPFELLTPERSMGVKRRRADGSQLFSAP